MRRRLTDEHLDDLLPSSESL
jgi:hypothetical protein